MVGLGVAAYNKDGRRPERLIVPRHEVGQKSARHEMGAVLRAMGRAFRRAGLRRPSRLKLVAAPRPVLPPLQDIRPAVVRARNKGQPTAVFTAEGLRANTQVQGQPYEAEHDALNDLGAARRPADRSLHPVLPLLVRHRLRDRTARRTDQLRLRYLVPYEMATKEPLPRKG